MPACSLHPVAALGVPWHTHGQSTDASSSLPGNIAQVGSDTCAQSRNMRGAGREAVETTGELCYSGSVFGARGR